MVTLYNSTLYPGYSGLLIYVNTLNTLFIPGMLFMIFMIAFLGSLMYQQKSMNMTNPGGSFAFASFLTLVVCIILSLIPGLVVTTYLLILLALTIVAVIWVFTSDRG